jgi:hypothetical protein
MLLACRRDTLAVKRGREEAGLFHSAGHELARRSYNPDRERFCLSQMKHCRLPLLRLELNPDGLHLKSC